MNRLTVVLLTALTLLLPSGVTAQTATLAAGAKVGLNSSTLTFPDSALDPGEEVTRRFGLLVGGWIRKDFTPNVGLTVEALLSQRGFGNRVDTTIFGEPLSSRSSVRLTYLDVPATLGWRSSPSSGLVFSAFGGAALSLKLSSSFKVDSVVIDGVNVTEEFLREFGEDIGDLDVENGIRTVDVGLVFGVGVERDRFGLDARYTLGLGDVSTLEDGPVTKNRTMSVMFSYRFK